MAGRNPSHFSDETWDLMTYGSARREELDYLRLTVLVSAIISAGKIAAGGEVGDSLRNSLQAYRSAMFPEVESDLLQKARQNEQILEQEYKKGALKVQSLEYATKRKKKRT